MALKRLPQFKLTFLYMTRPLDRLISKNKHLRLHGPGKYIVVSNIWNNKYKIPEAESLQINISVNDIF